MYQDGGVMTWFAVPDRFFMVHGMRGRCVKVPSRFSFCKLRRYSDGEISPESCWQKGFQGKQKTGLQYEDSQQTIICLLSGQCIPYTHMDPTWTRRLFDLKPTQQAKLLPISNASNEPSLVWFSLPSASVKAEAPEAAGAWTKGGRSLKLSGEFGPETNGWLEDGSPSFRNWVERPIVQELLLLVSRMVFLLLGCEFFTNAWQYFCMPFFGKWTFFEDTQFLIFFGCPFLGNLQGGLGNLTSNWRWLNSLNVIPGLQMSAQSLSTAPIGFNTSRVTLPETNIATENRPSEKKSKRKRSYSNHPFSGAKPLVSGRVKTYTLHK